MPIWVDLLDSANQKYDNTSSGLAANQAQAAIDEVNGNVAAKLNKSASVFDNFAAFTGAIVADATVDFTDGNKQVVNATTYPSLTLTFPGVGNYVLKITSSGDLSGISPAIDWGSAGTPVWAGASIVTLYYDGTYLYGSAIVGATI